MLPPWQPNELRVLAERRRLLVATASLQRVRLALELHRFGHSLRPRLFDALGSPGMLAVWALRALALWRGWRSLRRRRAAPPPA